MDLSVVGISATKLSSSLNYVDMYDVLSFQKIVSVLELKSSLLIILLSNGKILRYNPNLPPSKVFVEGIWEQYITCEIMSALLLESYPCVFYLINNSILFLKATEGDIMTALPQHIIASTLMISIPLVSMQYNFTNRMIIGFSKDLIQVIFVNKKQELVPFAPFQPSCQKFVCENCVFFSKKIPNLVYFLDLLEEPCGESISFTKDPSWFYLLKKCVIDKKEITESKMNFFSFESELVSADISASDYFVFVTQQSNLYVLKGNKNNGVRVNSESQIRRVRWNESGMMIILLTADSKILLYDICLNRLSVFSESASLPHFSLSQDGVLGKIRSMVVSENILVWSCTNLVVCRFLGDYFQPISNHLKRNNFNEALGCLDALQSEADFTTGFFLCWKYVYSNLQLEYIKILENTWTRNFHSRLPGPTGSKLLERLGYKLMHSGLFENAFLLARKLRSVRLLNDLAYYADFKGFRGIAVLAKHERENIDEDYVPPKAELENLIKITGRNMTSSDFCLLLNDYEEIINISRINDSLGKGGYLEEKNFWEIDLEAYAKALMLEGEGKFAEAFDIYKIHGLTHEVNRVNQIIENSSKSIAAKEISIAMEEVKE